MALCPGGAASPSGPTSSRLCRSHCEGAGQGVHMALPPSLTATSTAHRAPDTHTHTHTQWTDGLIDTLGLSSSISLACPSPYTHAPSLPRRTGLQGVPSPPPLHPRPGGAGSALPSLPRGWGLMPPEPAGAPVTVGLSTEIYWIKNKVIFILHMPQSLAASLPPLGVWPGGCGQGSGTGAGGQAALCSPSIPLHPGRTVLPTPTVTAGRRHRGRVAGKSGHSWVRGLSAAGLQGPQRPILPTP